MRQELSGRKAFVFGASSGIGRAVAAALGCAGVKVSLSYNRNAEGAEETMRMIPAENRGRMFRADLADADAVAGVLPEAAESIGGLDFAVLVAAQFHMAPLADCGNEIIGEIVSRNVAAPFIFAREAVRVLRQNGGGKILFVGSSQGRRPLVNTSLYAGTKGILPNLARSICLENGRDNIQSFVLSPGVTMSAGNIDNFSDEDSRRAAEQMIPAGKILTPEQFADIALRLLGEESGCITGSEILVDGGLLCTGAQI